MKTLTFIFTLLTLVLQAQEKPIDYVVKYHTYDVSMSDLPDDLVDDNKMQEYHIKIEPDLTKIYFLNSADIPFMDSSYNVYYNYRFTKDSLTIELHGIPYDSIHDKEYGKPKLLRKFKYSSKEEDYNSSYELYGKDTTFFFERIRFDRNKVFVYSPVHYVDYSIYDSINYRVLINEFKKGYLQNQVFKELDDGKEINKIVTKYSYMYFDNHITIIKDQFHKTILEPSKEVVQIKVNEGSEFNKLILYDIITLDLSYYIVFFKHFIPALNEDAFD